VSDSRIETDDVVVTNPMLGLLYMQVCAYGEVPPDQVEARANALNPSGTSNGWHVIVADDPEDEGPSKAPVACSDDDARLHYLLVC
jgi:hypothetical protein